MIKYLPLLLISVLACAPPTAPTDIHDDGDIQLREHRTTELLTEAPDGTLMGCRALATYFATHHVLDTLPDPTTDAACAMYFTLYEAYRDTITDLTDYCPCLVRDMVADIENAGGDVPDMPDVEPPC